MRLQTRQRLPKCHPRVLNRALICIYEHLKYTYQSFMNSLSLDSVDWRHRSNAFLQHRNSNQSPNSRTHAVLRQTISGLNSKQQEITHGISITKYIRRHLRWLNLLSCQQVQLNSLHRHLTNSYFDTVPFGSRRGIPGQCFMFTYLGHTVWKIRTTLLTLLWVSVSTQSSSQENKHWYPTFGMFHLSVATPEFEL